MLENLEQYSLVRLKDLEKSADPNIKYIGTFQDSSTNYVNIRELSNARNFLDSIWYALEVEDTISSEDNRIASKGFITLNNLNTYAVDSSSKLLVNNDIVKRADISLMIPLLFTFSSSDMNVNQLNQLNVIPVLISKKLLKDNCFSFAEVKENTEGEFINIEETTNVFKLAEDKRFLDTFQYRYVASCLDEYNEYINANYYLKTYTPYILLQKYFILVDEENPKGVITQADYKYFMSDEYFLMLIGLQYDKLFDDSFNKEIFNSDVVPTVYDSDLLKSNKTLEEHLQNSHVISKFVVFSQLDFPRPVSIEDYVCLDDRYFKCYNSDKDLFRMNSFRVATNTEFEIFNSIKFPVLQLKNTSNEVIEHYKDEFELNIDDIQKNSEIEFDLDVEDINTNFYDLNVNPIVNESLEHTDMSNVEHASLQFSYYTLLSYLNEKFEDMNADIRVRSSKLLKIDFSTCTNENVKLFDTFGNAVRSVKIDRIIPKSLTIANYVVEIQCSNTNQDTSLVTDKQYSELNNYSSSIYDNTYAKDSSQNDYKFMWYALDDADSQEELNILKTLQIVE